MADPVWGLLAKSQDDSETIEEAIVRLIGEHETDAGAHTGAGESLETHKTQDTIDHKADSIVPDKLSQVEVFLQTLFESLDSWQTQGTIINGLNRLTVTYRGDDSLDKYVYNEEVVFSQDSVSSKILNNYYQNEFSYSYNYYTADLYFGLGISDSAVPMARSLCWKIVDGVLSSGYGNDDTLVWESHGALAENDRHTVRILTDEVLEEAYFYLDSVLVRTVDISEMADPTLGTWGVYADDVGGTLNSQFLTITFYYLMWSRERQ